MMVNLAGFAALGAMLLTLFAWLRHDNRALRAEIKELRAEMNARFEKQSEEMSARFEKQSEEMKAGFEKQSEEMNARFAKQGDEIGTLRDEIGNLRERLARIEGLLEANILRGNWGAAPEPPHPEAA